MLNQIFILEYPPSIYSPQKKGPLCTPDVTKNMNIIPITTDAMYAEPTPEKDKIKWEPVPVASPDSEHPYDVPHFNTSSTSDLPLTSASEEEMMKQHDTNSESSYKSSKLKTRCCKYRK